MPKIKLSSPVRGISGKFANSDICYFISTNGETYARSAGDVDNPRTPSQTSTRAYMTAASKDWQNATLAQRNAWTDYAAAYFTRARDGSPLPPSGINAYVGANSIRQALGLSIVRDAPTEAPPAPLSAIEAVPGQNPDVLGIEITHSLTDLTGLQVLVKMTPETGSVSRKPTRKDLRMCCGVNSASAVPLTASGTTLIYGPTVYIINNGERFGIEAVIVRTADGIASQPAFIDAIKAI